MQIADSLRLLVALSSVNALIACSSTDPAGTVAPGSGGSHNAGDTRKDMNGTSAAGRGGQLGDSGNVDADRVDGPGGNTGTAMYRPFNDASPWNQRLASSPKLAADSVVLIDDFATSSSWPYLSINIETYSIPVYVTESTTPMSAVQVLMLGGEGFDKKQANVPIPAGAAPALGTDKHLSIVDRRTNKEWGFWDATKLGPSSWSCSVCATADLGGTGVRPPKDGKQPWWASHGARACGFPLIAGLITTDEIRAGSIEHALVIAYPHIRSHWYTYPASTAQGTTDLALPSRGLPCGARMQLDPALNLDTMGLSRAAKVVARALQEYGAFVGDFSGAVSLFADASPDAQTVWAGGGLSSGDLRDKIDLRRFRVLDLGALHEDDN